MAKYSQDELRQAAKIVLADRRAGGDRWFQLVLTLASRLRLNAPEVMARIEGLAK